MVLVLALPKYAVFKNLANSKILTLRKDKYLSFTGDSVLNPEAKFAIEPASSGNGQVHVRSAYNNKYLVRNSSGFVIADANKPEEDVTKDTCTLLEPFNVYYDDTSKIRFRHVQSGNYATLNYSGSAANLYDACLYAVTPSPDSTLWDALEVIDWETLVIFPSYNIALKGSNGYYLGGIWQDGFPYLQFSAGDRKQENASYRVESVGDGSVQVFSNHFSKYLVYNTTWIWANGTHKSPDDPKALFWPVQLDSNVIAFRSLGNNKFIRGLTVDGKSQCLNAWEKVITDECHITVEGLVISTSIHSIVYRHEDARIYDETPIVCGKGVETNDSHGEDTMQIPIKYREAKSTSWDNSVSLKLGGSITTFEALVPYIAGSQIKFEGSLSGEHKWGGTNDESFETGVTYTATIPPKTHVEINYVATKGTCDIPFSYTVVETYSDGTHKLTVYNDGLYTGVNCYSFDFDKKETPL